MREHFFFYVTGIKNSDTREKKHSKCYNSGMPFKKKFLYSGYDVLKGTFFAHEKLFNMTTRSGEKVPHTEKITFTTFDEYYNAVGEEIYDDACFFQYEFSDEEITKYNLDISRLNFVSIINYTIDDALKELKSDENNKIENPLFSRAYKTEPNSNPSVASLLSSWQSHSNTWKKIPDKGRGHYEINKWAYKNDFFVDVRYIDKGENITHKKTYNFAYFFDFVYFLKGDLSYASLGEVEGLENVKNIEQYNLDYALADSKVLSKAHAKLTKETDINFFKGNVEQSTTALVPTADVKPPRDLEESEDNLNQNDSNQNCRIYYISDLHLEYILGDLCAWSPVDVGKALDKIADELTKDLPLDNSINSLYVIAGDTVNYDSMDIYSAFLSDLAAKLSERYHDKYPSGTRIHPYIITTLGNWELNDGNIQEIMQNVIERCQEISNKYMGYDKDKATRIKKIIHLLDSLVYFDADMIPQEMSYEEIMGISDDEFTKRLKCTRVIMVGGPGLYFGTGIDPEDEPKETETHSDDPNLYAVYEKVVRCANGKQVIVVSHYQTNRWIKGHYYNNCIYVHGHNHRNDYHIEYNYRIYGDNQYGQGGHNKNPLSFEYPKFKYFYADSEIDIFDDYEDGIYDINPDEYVAFLRGKWMNASFNRKNIQIKMLKRYGYYMFVGVSDRDGTLYILNGGQIKCLSTKNIQYYYDHMLEVIKSIDGPLGEYNIQQQEIARAVKQFGGLGTIHGSIIDVDFYNHIFFNLWDRKMTPYYAYDITERIVYKDVATMLQNGCPQLYQRYKDNENNGNNFEANLPANISKPTIRGNRDQMHDKSKELYKQSRVLKKMEKINGKVLTLWPNVDIKSEKAVKGEKIKEIAEKKSSK